MKTGLTILLLALNICLVPSCFSQRYRIELVKDINPSGSSYPKHMVLFKDKLAFAAGTQLHGMEPWISDGTATGTVEIKNINLSKISQEADNSSNPTELTVAGDQLFFSANDQDHWYELWVSDGTEAGTKLVKDLRPGDLGSNPMNLTEFNGRLILSADEGYGDEPFISDGTPGGTYMIKNINNISSSYPTWFFEYDSVIYFCARDSYTGDELWRTDGTEKGTWLVRDLNPHQGESSHPLYFTRFDDKMFFGANSGNYGWELFSSDGTYFGSTLFVRTDTVNTIGSYPINLFVFNGRLYFCADDWIHGRELWSVSPNPEDLAMVADINPQGNADPENLTEMNGLLYFNATDSRGQELWVTDGTGEGTRLVKDLLPYGNSDPQFLTVFDNRLFFAGAGDLWVTDGTEAGTKLLGPDTLQMTSHLVSNLIVYNNSLYFSAQYDSLGLELYKVVVDPSSAPEPSESRFGISLWPNPCSDHIRVTIPCMESDARLEITDQLGKTVYSSTRKKGSTGPETVVTAGLASGLYCLRVTAGKQCAAAKFIHN